MSCYVASKPCGCSVAAAFDDDRFKRETAESVAEWIRDGLTVRFLSDDEARAVLGPCTHEPRQMGLPK